MADKKEPAAGWPVISGDYIVGDPESPVAVTTLASHIEACLLYTSPSPRDRG